MYLQGCGRYPLIGALSNLRRTFLYAAASEIVLRTCTPREDSDPPVHSQSNQNLHCAHF